MNEYRVYYHYTVFERVNENSWNQIHMPRQETHVLKAFTAADALTQTTVEFSSRCDHFGVDRIEPIEPIQRR